jgi:hypothetical protein
MKLFRNRQFIVTNLLCIFIISCAGNKVDGNAEWIETYGTRSGNWIYFFVDGKRISRPMDARINECDSCRYVLRYDKAHPEKADIDKSRPIFLPGERTIIIPAVITHVRPKNFLKGFNSVEFSFKIGDRSLDSYQVLPDDFATKYHLKAGDRYELEVWTLNTTRRVLHLDRPLADGTVLPDELLQLKVKKGIGY